MQTPQRAMSSITCTTTSVARVGENEFIEAAAEELKDDELIHLAEQRGYVIHKPRPIETPVLDVSSLTGKDRLKFAVVSCTHFGSKYQQLTALREFTQYADRDRKSTRLNSSHV